MIITQDLVLYDIVGEDPGAGSSGAIARPASAARASGSGPAITARSALAAALDAMETKSPGE